MKHLKFVLLGITIAFCSIVSSRAQAPGNDLFVNSWTLTGYSASTNGNSTGATKETGEPNFGGVTTRSSVWFNWTAPTNGLTIIDTIGSGFNTVLGVFTGNAVSALTQITSNNDADKGTTDSRVTFNAVQGTRYSIAVAGIRYQVTAGPYNLHLQMWPSVTFSYPTNNSRFGTPVDLPLLATASSPYGSYQVNFYDGATLLQTFTSPPFAYTITNAAIGTHTFSAVITDTLSLSATSTVTVTIAAPYVAITAPTNNYTQLGTANITNRAEALPVSTAAVARVDFYVNGTLFGSDNTSPYSFVWSNVFPGKLNLTAIMTDTLGLTYTSLPVTIYVQSTNAAPWVAFNDYGAGPGTHSNATTYDPFNNPSGALLDIQTGIAVPVYLTITQSGAVASGSGGAPNAGTPADLTFSSYIDWTNATSGLNAIQLPPGALLTYTFSNLDPERLYTFSGTAIRGVSTYTNRWTLFEISGADASTVAHTPNVLTADNLPGQLTTSQAVMNTGNNTSGDMIIWQNIQPGAGGTVSISCSQFTGTIPGTTTDGPYGYGLDALRLERLPIPTTVAITNPLESVHYVYPSNLNVSAATTGDYTVTNLEFLANGVSIGQRTLAPWSITWPNPAINTYDLLAIATDNSGARATSAVVHISIASNTPPAVAIATPTNNTSFITPVNITITASASDLEGTVTNVSFYADSVLLGRSSTSPFFVIWPNVPLGVYSLTAVASDNGGLSSTSAPVTVGVFEAVGSQWVAYNDSVAGTSTQTAANATTNDMRVSGGPYLLKKITDGSTIPGITMIMTNVGPTPVIGPTAGTPNPGTPLYNVFNGYCYFGANVIQIGSTTTNTITFSGLDPARRYRFQAGAVRGGGYTNRWGKFNLVGALFATPNHQQSATSPYGIITSATQPALLHGYEVAINTGNNVAGDMIEWDEIAPGPAGTFSVTSSQWSNTASIVSQGTYTGTFTTAGNSYAYALDAFRLEEFIVGTIVNLTAPTNDTLYATPASVTLSATAFSANGITNVAFYADGSFIGQRAASPFTLVWDVSETNLYHLTAVALDAQGIAATSSVVNISVISNDYPTVAMTVPVNGALYQPPVLVSLAATASDLFGIAKVEFYAGNTRVGQDTNAPYNCPWVGITMGTYQFRAVATDNFGLASTSEVVTIYLSNNLPPTVSIAAPTNNSVFTRPVNIPITVSASDPDGSVTNVAYYLNSSLLAQVRTAPFSFVWSNAYAGDNFLLTAVAFDNYGACATSAPVSFSVVQLASSTWVAYNDQYQGTASSPYDTFYTVASAGTSSGYLKNIADGTTVNGLVNITNFGNIGVAGTVSAPSAGTPAYDIFNAYIDWTGSGLYLYPTNVISYIFSGLDPAKIYKFTATSMRGGSGGDYPSRWTRAEILGALSYVPIHTSGVITSNDVPGSLINSQAAYNAGMNLAGDVVQWDNIVPAPNGTFTILTAQYRGALPNGGNASLGPYTYAFAAMRLEESTVGGSIVNITSPSANGLAVLPTNVVIRAATTGFPGTVTNVDFYAGLTKLGNATASPFSYTWSNPPVGTNSLRAVAMDTTGLAITSAPVTLRVQSNTPPSILIASPVDSAVFSAPADIAIDVQAADTDGSITNVEFYSNGSLIGQSRTAPFSLFWPSVSTNTYELTVRAFDDKGATTLSAPVRIFVIVSTAPTISTFSPPSGVVHALNSLTVTFTAPVSGVDASDLLLNGVPAKSVTGANATYTFTFTEPLEGAVTATWAPEHGIANREVPPKPFSGRQPNEFAVYTFTDNIVPTLTQISPPPGATLPSLNSIEVTFSEPVFGVDASDLRINGVGATSVRGAYAGPYVFNFSLTNNGLLAVTWAASHGIHDVSLGANPFVGSGWSYTLDTNVAQTNIMISEIMYHALPEVNEDMHQEWLEIHNKGATDINLTGWHLTKAVKFTFTNTVLQAGAYLVIAADVDAFHTRYPSVANVLGNWVGGLGNNGDTIQIENALGKTINQVTYASQGDWAKRLRARGENQIKLSRNGSTVTADLFFHDFSNGDWVWIYGADQPEFNGVFQVANATVSTFTYTAAGSTPQATGVIICRQLSDLGFVGWSWSSLADGLGRSLELMNDALPNDQGQNWKESSVLYGTPGRANSVATNNIPPMLLAVQHFPLIPTSTNAVTVSARIVDEQPGSVSARLYYRNVGTYSPPAFTMVSMYDDGLHADGAANDGAYAGQIPAQADHTIMEFYVEAIDAQGNRRTYPPPALGTNDVQLQWANALYQVDNSVSLNASNQPVYRIVLSASETNELRSAWSSARLCNAQMNATLVTIDGIETLCRYNVGIRNRGAGTRGSWPENYKVTFPNDKPWKGVRGIHLNTQYVHSQAAGYAMAISAGIDAEAARVVQVLLDGYNQANAGSPQYGSYIQLEDSDNNYAHAHWPDDGAGNIYRLSSGNTPTIHLANLSYLGTNVSTYVGDRSYGTTANSGRGYFKTSNVSENDWNDILTLMAVLATNTPDDTIYAQEVSKVANVTQWMRDLAVFQLLGSGETAFQTGVGDDYAIGRGVKDPRFLLLAHDLDTVLNQGQGPGAYNRTLFTMCPFANGNANATVLNRFMTNAYFAPIYFQQINELLNTSFTLSNLCLTLDRQLGTWAGSATLPSMKTWYTNRYNWVRSQINTNLTVTYSLSTSGGYPYTTSPTVTFTGAAHIFKTRSVLLNGSPAAWTAYLGTYRGTVALNPGVNRVLVQSLDTNGVAFAQTNLDIWYDDASTATIPSLITSDTVLTAAGGPYLLNSTVTVGGNSTLTIQPGTTLYLGSGVNIAIATGSRLVAEGTATAPIRLTRTPGTATSWGGITIEGEGDSPETRLAYVHIEFNGTTAIHSSGGSLFMDHVTFGTTAYQYLSLDSSSFIVQNCTFPTPTAAFEPAHGTGGIRPGGHGIFLRNFFGAPNGYNDVIDFTGGNRPGGPIVQFIDNVFTGASDDILDLDGTDAWVEGNIFLHAHKNGSPDSSSGVSGGNDGANTSEITIIGNIFYDCDQAAMGKQGDFFTLFNNTIVHQTHVGGTDTAGAVVMLSDPGTAEGLGMYLEGNILYDLEALTRGVTAATVTFSNNLMSLPWSGPGGNNTVGVDPLFNHVPQLSETYFTSWDAAQIMKQWFGLRTGSPACQTGPNGLDKGGVIPMGVSISGAPLTITTQSNATLTVGLNRTGSAIPTAGFPNGSGYTHYKYRLDSGAWGPEIPINTPITLSSLSLGPHYVQVVGKRDSGIYQDDPMNGVDAVVSTSRTWIVNPSAFTVCINELLALNQTAVPEGSKYPDLIELYNFGGAAADLSGCSISDDPKNPRRFVFPPGTTLAGNSYLKLYADSDSTPPGLHVGFGLNQDGDGVYLFSPTTELLDSIQFGPQIPDLSIGRLDDGAWGLTYPTFGAANRAAPVGNYHNLRINEWLTHGLSPVPYDYIELYNPESLPVNLGGLYLTDNPIGAPRQFTIASLSFVRPGGFPLFYADNNPSAGLDHLNFKLSGDRGVIGLLDNDGLIDFILYGPQTTDVPQGRSPNGSSNIVSLPVATPGGPNPAPSIPAGSQIVINEVLAKNIHGLTNVDGGTPEWIELYNPTPNPINVSDMSLSDNVAQPRKFVFSANIIPSLGYLVVLCDPSQPPSTNVVPMPNTSFGIKANGGQIYVFDKFANGGSQIDFVEYGVQANDWSIGRLPSGSTNWLLGYPTPAAANTQAPLGDPTLIKINEWMALPASGSDWFELYNPNPQPVELSGLYLTDDLGSPATRRQFQIPPLSFMGTGLYGYERFWADKDLASGPNHVNFALAAGGEAIGLTAPGDRVIDAITFPAQQSGVSEGRLPDGSTNIVRFPETPTPADANYLPLTNMVINEVLSGTNANFEQAIELLNVSPGSVDIGGWYLSNKKHELLKFRIPDNTVIAPGAFAVFYQNQFYYDPRSSSCFLLDANLGDQVYLSAADAAGNLTGYRASVEFGAADPAISFGRFTNTAGQVQFTTLSYPTFGVSNPDGVDDFRRGTGASNAYPRVGPVVIAEIMYHPPDFSGGSDNSRDEYVRLQNITATNVPLFDPDYPANRWALRGDVDYFFNNVAPFTLGPGQSILLVHFDPFLDTNSLAAFNAAHPELDTNIVFFGPYSGKLDNGNASVIIRKPGVPLPQGQLNAGYVPYIEVEYVHYFDRSPWDPAADGTGASLLRLDPYKFANDPNMWAGYLPMPGPGSLDSDGDGIQDWWMLLYFGHPTGQIGDHSMPYDDPDQDGMINLQEYQAGTSPIDAASTLRLYALPAIMPFEQIVLRFNGVYGKDYSIQYRDALGSSPNWEDLLNVGPLMLDGTVWITNQVPANFNRFYRVITPANP